MKNLSEQQVHLGLVLISRHEGEDFTVQPSVVEFDHGLIVTGPTINIPINSEILLLIEEQR